MPTLSLGALLRLAMSCCLDAVDLTCHTGLSEVLSPGRLPQLRSLVFSWQQQASSAAPIACCGRLSSAARVVLGEQRCCVAGQGSGAVVLEFLGEHARGGGVKRKGYSFILNHQRQGKKARNLRRGGV